MEEGLDLSHHNGDLQVGVAVQAGQTFFVIKSTEGTSYVDPKFLIFVQQVVAGSEADWGGYHFFRPSFNPEMQADNFYNTITSIGHKPTLEWHVDVEYTDGLQPYAVDQRLRRFLKRLMSYGIKPEDIGIYTRKTFFDPYVSTNSWYAQFKLWVAHYGVTNPWVPSAWVKAGKTWDYHQYTSTHPGAAYGVTSTYVDGNRARALPPKGPTIEELVAKLVEEARAHGWSI